MTSHRRFIAAMRCAAVLIVVLGAGSADAQRGIQRVPAPAAQGRYVLPRPPILARPPYSGPTVYRAPLYRPYYYGRPSYLYGGFNTAYYSYPFSFSVGIEPGYPYYRFPDYPYYPYYEPYPSYPFYRSYPSYPSYPPDRDSSNAYGPNALLQLSVVPRHAEVFIDGFYVGTVDDFDGSYEGRALRVEPGNHSVEVFLPGHRTLTQKIYLQSDRTFTLGALLEPLAPGETEPVRPGAPRP